MALTVTGTTSSSISVRATSGYQKYKFFILGSLDAEKPSNTHTYTGLGDDTTYGVACDAWNGTQWVFVGNTSARTKIDEPSDEDGPSVLSSWDATYNSITVQAAASDPSGVDRIVIGGRTTYSSSASETFTGLSPDTQYSYTVRAYDELGNYTSGTVIARTDKLQDNTDPSVDISLSSKTTTTVTVNVTASDASGIDRIVVGEGQQQSVYYSSPATKTFTGLSPNTTYLFYATAYDNAGNSNSDSVSITTDSGLPSVPSQAPRIDSRTEGGFNLSWGSSSAASSYTLKLRRGYDGQVTTYTTPNSSYEVSGLNFAVTYYLSVRANNSNGSSSYTGESTATTAPRTPSLEQGQVTNTSISVTVTGLSGNWDDITVDRLNTSGTKIDSQTVVSNGWTAHWSGLAAGSTWRFRARTRFYVNGVNLYSVNYSNLLTVQVSARPANFEWTTAKSSGSCNSSTKNINLTHGEWNSFLEAINRFRQYKGLAAYSFNPSTVSSGQTFTASMYTQARTAIHAMSPPTPVPISRSSGQEVKASYLNGLRDSLNSIT